MNRKLAEKVKKIKLLILDVDGILTDGKIVYASDGSDIKEFDVKDGFGISLLCRAGIKTAILTARYSKVIRRRAKDMHIDAIYQDAFDKLKVYHKILKKFKIKSEEVCFAGDDLVDLPVLKRVGFSACTACSMPDIKKEVDYVTEKTGGSGAVRELVELILKNQNKWQRVTKKYYN